MKIIVTVHRQLDRSDLEQIGEHRLEFAEHKEFVTWLLEYGRKGNGLLFSFVEYKPDDKFTFLGTQARSNDPGRPQDRDLGGRP